MSRPRPAQPDASEARLPRWYFAVGVLSLLLALGGVVSLARDLTGHYYHPRLIALTHTVTLGWITVTTMGASYQVLPVSPERSRRRWRLARWQLVVLVAGLVGLIPHFYISQFSGMLWAAGLVGVGGIAHAANLGSSVGQLARGPLSARLFGLGLVGLVLTLLFGLVLATDRVFRLLPGVGFFPILHAHFHLALLGWLVPTVLAVVTRTCGMSLQAAEPARWSAATQLWGLMLGVPLLTVGTLALPPLVPVGAVAVAAAGVGHVAWVQRVSGGRPRGTADWGLRFIRAGAGFLLLGAALGIGLALDVVQGPRAALAYAAVALGGWASLTLAGTLVTLLPTLAAAPTTPLTSTFPAVAWLTSTVGVVGLTAALALGNEEGIRAAGATLALGAMALAAPLTSVVGRRAG